MTQLTHTQLQELKANIEDGLEELSIKLHPTEHRNHLGISEIGEDCKLKLYFKFRWVKLEQHDGWLRRLFARGHREEERYINYLEGIGCKVYRFSNQLWYSDALNKYKILEYDADLSGGTGSYTPTNEAYHIKKAEQLGLKLKQFRVSGVLGHYGGSCDGVVITPWYPDAFIAEFKTHNAKSFAHYIDKGLQISKPKHFDQMCGYGEKMQIQYGLYFPENKNDDDIQVTPIKLDWERAKVLEKKAEEIILAKERPPKISENPAYYACKTCFALDICHHGAIPEKNCRSCVNSTPVDNAQWHCKQWDSIIPSDNISKGCDRWMPI